MLGGVLLVSFSLSALAVVGAVGWLGRTGSPVVAVGAVVLALALTALVLARLTAMLPERPRPYPRFAWLVPGLAAVALLVPLGVTAVARAPLRPSASPQGTVRGFLGAVVDRDGVSACRYLTAGARRDFERTGSTCESFFGQAELRLGGHGFTSDGQVGRLAYASAGRRVTVSWHGHGLGFQLRRASPRERAEFLAPPTPWRIASNVSRLG
jgi:hypothetical protein